MENKLEQVKFTFGNNIKYDYYILDEKTQGLEINIEEDSLAYKIGGEGIYLIGKFTKIPFGNFDYILEIKDKETDNFRGLTLASIDEIERK